jgi:hypothetical protein
MPRPNRSVALLCVAVVALAAFLPGITAFDQAWFELQYVLLPDDSPVLVERPSDDAAERTLVARLLPSRAPPSLP